MTRTTVVERISAQSESLFYHEHVARYRFAQAALSGGWILDIACGSGYGSHLLVEDPRVRVVGVDIHLPTLTSVRQTYQQDRLSLVAASGLALPFGDHTFQAIVSLETIEHLDDDQGFLREVVRVLHPDGTCILSTPDKAYSLRHRIVNPYHVREYFRDELGTLLTDYFGLVELYSQGFTRYYHDRARTYAATIQETKRHFHPLLRYTIDRLYRPLKSMVPGCIDRYLLRRLLGQGYPQPDPEEIVISTDPVEDASVTLAICRYPRREGLDFRSSRSNGRE
ncbi:MAG: class I SAM-dependent methyltransferase [Chloroflexi bacterium]|nr:class I SAM-dependent methyltransferase [Chloroflexota bacterium]